MAGKIDNAPSLPFFSVFIVNVVLNVIIFEMSYISEIQVPSLLWFLLDSAQKVWPIDIIKPSILKLNMLSQGTKKWSGV